jgi:hypothetical protein
VIEYAGMHACASQPNPSTEITDVLSWIWEAAQLAISARRRDLISKSNL